MFASFVPQTSRVPCWIEDEQCVFHLPVCDAEGPRDIRKPLIPETSRSTRPTAAIERQAKGGIIFPLSSDHLIILLQYNVLRACMTNRAILSQFFSTSIITDCASAQLHILPSLPSCIALPPALQPTFLQRTIPHEEWVDIIPHPVWRDNVIRAIGSFDEDQLWSDTIGGLFEGFPHSEIEQRGVIVWSPPWDVSGWEMSEGFLRKWGWSLKNCDDILNATNTWRRKRGEEPLNLV